MGYDNMFDDFGYGDDPVMSQPDTSPAPTPEPPPDAGPSTLSYYLDLINKNKDAANGLNQPGSGAADLGSIIGAFSSGEKANRFMKGNFTQNYDKLMLDAQASRNSNESDALKKLAQTAYITGGGSQFKAPSFSLNGKTYQTPDLGFGPAPTTAAEKTGAGALQAQLQARLSPGGSYTPQPLSDYADPGLAENISSYGGAAASGVGAIMSMLGGGQSGGNDVGSIVQGLLKQGASAGTIAKLISGFSSGGGANGAAAAATSGSGLGSALGMVGKYAGPVAGAALGTYGLAKNASVGSDVMSGVGAGASIGSVIPGIGTAIGAGIGGLVGALRGAWSVTGKEQSGRDAQAQIAQNLSKIATPQQMAESKQAGWADPNQALSLIVMRDAYTKAGLPPAQAEAKAEAAMHGMWDGEKGGVESVNAAFSPISHMLGPQSNPFMSQSAQSSYPAGTDAFSRGAYKG